MKIRYRHTWMLFISLVILSLSLTLILVSARLLTDSSETILLQTKSILSTQAKRRLLQIARQQSDTVGRELARIRGIVRLASDIMKREPDTAPDVLETMLESMRENAGAFSEAAFFVSADRSAIDASEDAPVRHAPAGSAFECSGAESVQWGAPRVNRLHPVPELVVDVRAPVVRPDGFEGCIWISVFLPRLITQFNARQPIRSGASFIIDDERDFDVHRLLDDVEDMFRLKVKEKGLALVFHRESGLPRYARADDGKLRQVLVNLLGNALKIWKTWEPHLILMDMRMPGMDGFESTKRIKSATKGKAAPIIAVTVSVFEEERAEMLSAGCDDLT